MKKILVPCDFSETAREAFKFARNIAAKNEGEIYVLYVADNTYVNVSAPEVPYPSGANETHIQKVREQLTEKFLELKNEYGSPDITVKFKVDVGGLTETIENFISDKKIELVVMGTHGASGLKEFFIGSNTEKIVRYSSVPVVAVPLGSQFDTIDDIVFPVVPSDRSTSYIHALKTIQNFYQARLQILWINTPHMFKSDDEALEDLQEFADQYHFHNYKLNIRNDHAEQEGILRFARETKAGLIFMPTHSRKGLFRWLTGSITENVVNHVQCPVWTHAIKN